MPGNDGSENSNAPGQSSTNPTTQANMKGGDTLNNRRGLAPVK